MKSGGEHERLSGKRWSLLRRKRLPGKSRPA
jgi:hypothetical protein